MMKTQNLHKLGGPKTHADSWTRQPMKMTLSLPREKSGIGTKTTVSLPWTLNARMRFWQGEKIKAIKDLRQKDEQDSSCIRFYRAIRLVKDHLKKGYGNGVSGPHHLRLHLAWTGQTWWTSRKFEDYQWFFCKAILLQGGSRTGSGDSFVSDRRWGVSRVWLKDLTRVPGHMVAAFLMSFLKQSSSRAHVMSHTLPDHAPFSRCSSTLRSLSPCSIVRTGQLPVQLRKDSYLAVLPNRARSQVLSRAAETEVNFANYSEQFQEVATHSGLDEPPSSDVRPRVTWRHHASIEGTNKVARGQKRPGRLGGNHPHERPDSTQPASTLRGLPDACIAWTPLDREVPKKETDFVSFLLSSRTQTAGCGRMSSLEIGEDAEVESLSGGLERRRAAPRWSRRVQEAHGRRWRTCRREGWRLSRSQALRAKETHSVRAGQLCRRYRRSEMGALLAEREKMWRSCAGQRTCVAAGRKLARAWSTSIFHTQHSDLFLSAFPRIRESSETPSPYVRRETRGGVLTQEKIKSRFKCCAGAFFRITKNCDHWEVRDFRELRTDEAVRGKNCSIKTLWGRVSYDIVPWGTEGSFAVWSAIRAGYARIEGRKVQTELFKNQVYSFTLKGWNSNRRIQEREKNRLCTELDWRERVLQEDGTRNLQVLEEFKKICCTEPERPKQLRIDELPAQEKESQSTVNLLTVQIQELQDKVKSLSDSREFCDPETASSSGLSHVPSHPMSIPSPRGMLSRDSCLQLDTRNSYGTSGNVFENLLAPNEPSAALRKFKKSCSGTMRARVSENRKTFCASGWLG